IPADAYAEPRMADIKANLPQTYFAWSGPTTNGSVIYYRIQGPTLVIEYAPQGTVDHIHTIYRDPTNDYGAKFAHPSTPCAGDGPGRWGPRRQAALRSSAGRIPAGGAHRGRPRPHRTVPGAHAWHRGRGCGHRRDRPEPRRRRLYRRAGDVRRGRFAIDHPGAG